MHDEASPFGHPRSPGTPASLSRATRALTNWVSTSSAWPRARATSGESGEPGDRRRHPFGRLRRHGGRPAPGGPGRAGRRLLGKSDRSLHPRGGPYTLTRSRGDASGSRLVQRPGRRGRRVRTLCRHARPGDRPRPGPGACRRQVHDIIDERPPARTIWSWARPLTSRACGPAIRPTSTTWTSPRSSTRWRRSTSLRSTRPKGFGVQALYSKDPARPLNEAHIIGENDAVALPYGYHPVAAAPGYRLYYLWFLSGSTRKLVPHDDPDHAWVKRDLRPGGKGGTRRRWHWSTTSSASSIPWPFRGRATPKRPREARRRPPTSCPASGRSSTIPISGGIEITQIKDPGLRAQVARLLADAGMEVTYSAQPVQLLNEDNLSRPHRHQQPRRGPPPPGHRPPQSMHRRGFGDRRRRIGIISGKDPGAAHRISAMEALILSLDELCAYAAERSAGAWAGAPGALPRAL